MIKSLRLLTCIGLITVFSLASHTAESKEIKINDEGKTRLELLSKSDLKLKMVNSIGQIGLDGIGRYEGDFVRLVIPGYTNSYEIGSPNLPAKRQLIEIPHGATPVVNIISFNIIEYDLSDYGASDKIVPVQPPQPKCGDAPGFECNNDLYETNGYLKSDRVTVDVLGKMREVRIARININPVEYNPVENKIRVYENLVFEITFKNADLALTEYQKRRYFSPYFKNLFSMIGNYAPTYSRDNLTLYPVKYVIISDRMFESQLQPFIDWKEQKGFIIVEAYTDVIGDTKEEIKDYIQDLYDAGTEEDPAPSFVLFVGDIAQVPTWNNGDGVTDRNYLEYTGDLFPEIFYGRFSAENTDQLQPYIDKTLQYEQYTMPDPSYLEEVVMIAGMDGSHGYDWGNGQINYGTINYFNEDHDILSHTYLYPVSGSSGQQIRDDISNGVTFANYTAHCSPSGWGDPSFTISHISALTNQDKYGLLIGNCCSSSEYQTTCFAEEIVRAEYKGAVGYIGGSNSTFWDEDYYFGVGVGQISEDPPSYEETTLGNYDRSFHDHSEPFGDWYVTMDQVVFAGNLAVSESGSSSENYYWDIYNLIGDPSLMIYYGVPDELSVDHDPMLLIGATSFDIETEAYAYIALHIDDETAIALADENGDATLNFTAISSPGTADLVITAQNFQPHSSEIMIIAPEGPFCIYQSHIMNDDSLGNGNNHADFNESVFLSITIENYGSDDAIDVNVMLDSENSFVTIVDGDEAYDTILSNQAVTRENGFQVELADNTPDQLELEFTLTTVDENDSTWISEFSFVANAPVLSALNITVIDEDGDGILEPGESGIIKIETANTGHCPAENVVASLQAYNPYITVLSGDTTIPTLGLVGAVYPEFDVQVSDDAPEGIFGELHYHLSSGAYEISKNYYPKIGLLLEDWETGGFTKYDWDLDGDANWEINMEYPYEGAFDAKSGELNDDESAELSITFEVMSHDSIIFYKKVSSEEDYDFLKFYIDNTLTDTWSGTSEGWRRQAYSVEPGEHTFKWIYEKDYYVSEGADCAWVDYILLPTMMVTTIYTGPDNEVCTGNGYFQCIGSATNYDTIYWSTEGTGSFNNINILTPQYNFSEDDIENGEVLLALNLIDKDGYPASDTMLLQIIETPQQPVMPFGPDKVNVDETTESDYTIEEVENTEQYLWSLYPEEAGIIDGTGLTGHVVWNDQYEGDAYVKVAAQNQCGTGAHSDSLYIIVSNPVGFEDITDDLTISIVPNPGNDFFVVNINSGNQKDITLSVLNYLGQQVIENKQLNVNGDHSISLDLSHADAGIYFVLIQYDNSRIVRKLMLNK